PAITPGINDYVGSVEAGKLADLVLWRPAFFGVKPEMVIKGGLIAGALMGDGNASIPTPQPCIYRPMFGSYGLATNSLSFHFVSAAGLAGGSLAGLHRAVTAVRGCRKLRKTDMKLNDATPTSRSTLKRMRCVPTGSCFSAILRKLSPSLNVIFFFNTMTVVEQIVPVEDISPRYEGYRRETLTLTWEERRQGHGKRRSDAGLE